jgi:ferredoxin-NADP reductase/ferredoxin/truncated hemoglobin YjbI
MHTITYRGNAYSCRQDETLLDAFLRQGVDFPFSCRSGACHVCMHRSEGVAIPAEAQQGLAAELQQKGYFLPCKCRPGEDMTVLPPDGQDLFIDALLAEKEPLAQDITLLRLEPYKNFDYQAGQFVNLRDVQGNLRSYSLASVPGEDYFLELHVRCLPQGKVSRWLCDELEVGETLAIQGPEGECYYRPGNETAPLLLVATGTGLAPLYGIVRQALAAGHTGAIHLYHGGRRKADCYLHAPLNALAAQHENFHYTAVVRDEEAREGFVGGELDEVVLAAHPQLDGWCAYLAGAPQTVERLEAKLHEAGVAPDNLYSDPFYTAAPAAEASSGGCPVSGGSTAEMFPPDPEMWQALQEGELLSRILNDFYTRVYQDPRLNPFFDGVTKQRAVEKQYLFLRQLFTGEKVYFGDRPRNAHHWMVISDELFDYREAIMLACLRRHGLPEHLIERWHAIENAFRADIVKEAPWPKMLGDIELPLEGYEETVLEVGSMCDSCGDGIDAGVTVRYHLRLGHVYCPACMEKRA